LPPSLRCKEGGYVIVSQLLPPPCEAGRGIKEVGTYDSIYYYLCPIKIMKVVESQESTRQKKVSRLIQKEIAEIFLRKGNEYAPGKMISITKVRISPDLSFARVYLSIYPSGDKIDILHSVQEHIPRIRFDLGHKVRSQLRIVPEIAFFIDDSLDYIDNINKLLKS
jgi:ribosome-binding factor A